MFTDYYFWFAQPSSVLSNYDNAAGYLFAGLIALSIILGLVSKFAVKHPLWKKLLGRYANAFLWIGMAGMIWFGLRYESVPILSKRFWAGLILAWAIIWIGFIKWYLFSRFMKEKTEHDYNQVKSRYMPGSR